MKQAKLRKAEREEIPGITKWLENGRPKNLYDEMIWKYPTLNVLCAYNENGPLAYLPLQTAFVLESTALRPGLSRQESAAALRDLIKGAELLASANGVKELYMVTADDELATLASHHGFEELPYRTFRMRL